MIVANFGGGGGTGHKAPTIVGAEPENFEKYGVSRSLEMAFSESSTPYADNFW